MLAHEPFVNAIFTRYTGVKQDLRTAVGRRHAGLPEGDAPRLRKSEEPGRRVAGQVQEVLAGVEEAGVAARDPEGGRVPLDPRPQEAPPGEGPQAEGRGQEGRQERCVPPVPGASCNGVTQRCSRQFPGSFRKRRPH